MTNREKINAMDNTELANLLSPTSCNYCIYRGKDCKDKSCTSGIKEWLESEGDEQEVPVEKNPDKAMINNPPADNVNHPSHYTFGKIEVIDFIEDKKLGFHLGNAVKYISRAGRKDPAKTIEDLRKAAWYLNRQITRLEMSLGGQNG